MHIRKNLQDSMLNSIRKSKQTATFFLTNGFQLKGVVTGFDSFVIVLQSDGRQQIIYKHAVSTIVPMRAVAFPYNSEEESNVHGEERALCEV